jgi:hypothetical protein
MKQTAELNKAQENMRPGVITLHGMLGHDKRKLVDILMEDDATVKRLGTTHAAIAQRLRVLREEGAEGLGLATDAEDHHFVVRVDDVRGKLPCPFEDCVVQKSFTEVELKNGDDRLLFTDLNIHMIEAHGFYEGHGSAFRLEPAHIVEMLGIPRTPPDAPDKEIFGS